MYKCELDGFQRKAIEVKDGAFLCIAGPGSGKTTVITHRVLSLIDKGVNPENILVITFTKKAAVSMEKRFKDMIGDDVFMPVTFGTFHSVFFRIIRDYTSIKVENMVSDKERTNICFEVLKKLGYLQKYDKDAINDALNMISVLKNNLENDNGGCDINLEKNDDQVITGRIENVGMLAMVSSEYAKTILNKYNEILNERKLIDYEDILIIMRKLCICNRGILEKIQEKYKYIMIDEFQDINELQIDIIKRISDKYGNIYAVGDEDQAIYGFRGARSDIMLKFNKIFKDARVLNLSNNYRSDVGIISTAKKLIVNNKMRYNKDICGISGDEGTFAVKIYQNANDEFEFIREKTVNRKKGESIAILIRKNIDGIVISNYLDRLGIKHDFDLIGHPMYKMGIMYEVMKDIKVAVRSSELYNVDSRIIGRLKPPRALEYILNAKGYNLRAKANVMVSDGIDILRADSRKFATINEWIDYADGVIKDDCNKRIRDKTLEPYPIILTMHASKGLEFDTVIIPMLNEGIIPNRRVVTEEDLEEERRLLYVAMTRAKHNLYITARKSEDGKSFEVSRFYQEIVGDFIVEKSR